MQAWEPQELRLVRRGASVKDDDGSIAYPAQIMVLQEDGSWAEDDGMKYPGEQRLRILFAAEQGAREADLAYYFERLAPVQLHG
jgi:hypothetical protein